MSEKQLEFCKKLQKQWKEENPPTQEDLDFKKLGQALEAGFEAIRKEDEALGLTVPTKTWGFRVSVGVREEFIFVSGCGEKEAEELLEFGEGKGYHFCSIISEIWNKGGTKMKVDLDKGKSPEENYPIIPYRLLNN